MELDGYYINLSTSSDRRERMEAQLQALGCQSFISRFPAIDGRVEGPFDNMALNGVWACRQSHERVIAQASTRSATLIFEDDVEISNELPVVFNVDTIGGYVENNPSVDLLFLDCSPFNHQVPFLLALAESQLTNRSRADVNDSERYRTAGINVLDAKGTYAYSTASYLVTPKGKERLKSLFASYDGQFAVDMLYRDWIANGMLEARITVPFFATPKFRNDSTIAYAEFETANVVERENKLSNAIRRLLFAGPADLDDRDIALLLSAPMTEASREYWLGMQLYEATRRSVGGS